MKAYNARELAEIIEKHWKWLHSEDGGERANLSDADLSCACLRGADLSRADLRGADLSDADLRCACLRGADLSDADLRCACLRGADLSRADLRGADLSEIRSLWNATGNMSEIKSVQCDLWPVTYTADMMQIGCQFHAIAEWWEFSDSEINRMDSQALAWWSIWKPILKNIIEVSPATPGKTDKE